MRMNMAAGRNVSARDADCLSVLADCLALGNAPQRHFMTARDCVAQADAKDSVTWRPIVYQDGDVVATRQTQSPGHDALLACRRCWSFGIGNTVPLRSTQSTKPPIRVLIFVE